MFALGMIVFVALGIFIFCQDTTKQEDPSLLEEVVMSPDDPGVEYPVSENHSMRIGNIGLAKKNGKTYYDQFDTKGKGDPVAFVGAAGYYLPKDIKHYAYYHKLLEGDGKSKYNFLKYLVGEFDREIGAFPIIKVEIPSEEERKWIEKSYEPHDVSHNAKVNG